MLYFTASGGLSFGTTNGAYGTSGQILKSNGDAPPTWVAASTVIGGPYLPLAGGTLTGTLDITNTYPRINLNDTNHEDDWSIINDDGNFTIYNVDDGVHALRINSSNATTFAGDIVMGDHDITGIDFLQFTSGTYLTDVSSNYVKLNYASTGAGGIIVYDGDSALQGYLYADGASTPSFGLLTGAGQWGVRTVKNGLVELRHNNAITLLTTSTGICVCGDLTVSGGDITLGGTGRIQGIDTVSSGTDAASKNYVDTCLATTGNLCGATAQCIFDSVYNFCIGPNAGEDFTSGSNNTLIGKCAGRCITTGAHNVSIGSRAGEKNCVKSYNVSLGYQAGFCGQGCGSTAIGQAALQNASSDNSVAIGKCTLYAASGNSNTAIGAQALQNMTSGQNNFGLGAIAGFALQTGNGNVFIGQDASRYQTSGDNVVAIGKRAGRCHSGGTRTVGNNNIYIGQDTKSSANSTSNEIVIGCGAVGCGSNKAMIGNSSVTVVCSNGSFSTVSDIRDKTCICDLEFGLDFIGNLKPKTFNMITDRSDPEGSISCKRHGFIAQDVIALEGDDPVITNNDNPDRLGYTGEHIIPILVKGMQEQQAVIDNLTARLEALEG